MSSWQDNPINFVEHALVGGSVGVTLQEGKPLVMHQEHGKQSVQEVVPTRRELWSILGQMLNSRERREVQDGKAVYFTFKLNARMAVLGGASIRHDELRVELRQMVDQHAHARYSEG
jgi:hypothetical protein